MHKKKLQKQKWPRKLIIMRFHIITKWNLFQQKTKTTYEVCNNIGKHKHLWGNWSLKIGFSNTSDLQNQLN
jgi:hypothetical protein